MNKISIIAARYHVVLFAILFLLIGSSPVFGFEKNVSMDETIENRIMSLGSSVDVQYNSEVKRRIRQYTVSQRKTTEVLLGRVSIYFPTYENVLREKGLPMDLKYLSVIESGLRPNVTSRSGAAGLWQFMKPTGRMMGLKINRTVDERRDVEKSTIAAAEYLSQLHESFGDWTLALAAYNCGPGNLRKAIRKSGGKRSFWEIKKYLPKETREYVPKFIAMTYVMNYYYEHDLIPNLPNADLINTSSAKVFEKISFKKLAKEHGIDIATIKLLNPSFIRNYIPKTEEGKYRLVLPTDNMRIVAQQYHVQAELPLLPSEVKIVEAKIEVPQSRGHISIPQPISVRISGNDHDKLPLKVVPNHVHFVRLGDEEERRKEQRYKPESYRIDKREKSIADISLLVYGSKKSL